MGHVLATSNLVIGLCHLAQFWTFGMIIRRRHDRTVGYVFWLMGIFFLFAGLNRLAYSFWHYFGEAHPKEPQAMVIGFLALGLNVLAAVVSLSATVFMIWITPRVMKIPSVTKTMQTVRDIRGQMYQVFQQLAEAKDIPEGDEKRLRAYVNAMAGVAQKVADEKKEEAS